jgi:hypothetical protein
MPGLCIGIAEERSQKVWEGGDCDLRPYPDFIRTMRIRRLVLENFGPFQRYDLPFTQEEPACMLLTGRNNEGKSNIILALKLLSSALRSTGRRQMRVTIDGSECYKLPQQDIQDINIGRMLHNYSGNRAVVRGVFDEGLTVTVVFDETDNLIYSDYVGVIPKDSSDILGFVPPLGPLAEHEEFLSVKHVKASINTSLAPRHLRNHFAQILSANEYTMLQDIIARTWPGIRLLDYERNLRDNSLICFFKEGRIERELAWAGQGLQIWFQIITHLIRLRSSSILVLDEPEVNLHAEKQNDLIQVLKEYYRGSVIIATHSAELMNNVDVSHIVHVQKRNRKPTIKKTSDRTYLNLVRSKIGSNFNLIASQFEAVDLILFTEDASDFSIIRNLANAFGFAAKAFNIPLHGFSEYPKALSYRDAYKLLIGIDTPQTVLLDRDYYPEDYLSKAEDELTRGGLKVIFTPGKEIENLFLSPRVLRTLIPEKHHAVFELFWDRLFEEKRLDAYSSYLTLHKQFLPSRLDMKTVTQRFTPVFESMWVNKKLRHRIIEGKVALHRVRSFFREATGANLTMQSLTDACVTANDPDARRFAGQAFGGLRIDKNVLR